MKKDNFKKDKWYHITTTYDGSGDEDGIKMYYNENIDGVDYSICMQNGKIISKIPLTDITW